MIERKKVDQENAIKDKSDLYIIPAKKKTLPLNRRIPQTLMETYNLIYLKEKRSKQRVQKLYGKEVQASTQQNINKLSNVFGNCEVKFPMSSQYIIQSYSLNKSELYFHHQNKIHIRTLKKITLSNGQSHHVKLLVIVFEKEGKQQKVSFRIESRQQLYSLMSGLIVRKLLLEDFYVDEFKNPDEINRNNKVPHTIKGEILMKRGFLFKKWQKLSMRITDDFEVQKIQSCIDNLGSVNSIETSFTMYQAHLVVRISQRIFCSSEIGIPLIDFSNLKNKKNWLFHLTKLMR